MTSSPLSCVGNIQMSRLKANKSTQVLRPPTTQKRRNCNAIFTRLRFVAATGATIPVDIDIMCDSPTFHFMRLSKNNGLLPKQPEQAVLAKLIFH